MTRLLSYRGPDGEGFHDGVEVGLGHRRLSIIDLSHGAQPIWSHDDRAVIVYNGEIYNYPQLRKELEGRGVRFRTHTDTEVVVNLYREYGDDFVARLNGIFAFAIWEPARKRLFLARDQLGVKPLLYLERDGVLLFASEAKSLLLWDGYRPEVNPAALRESLIFSFIPGDETLLAGIRKLPPGHTMVFERGRSEIRPYWWLDPGPAEDDRGEAWYATRLRELLEESVRAQMISDVPVGATLSGGIDSSAIVALMSRITDRPVRTFSIGFGGPRDEVRYARMVAEKFRTDHQEFIIDPGRFTAMLPRVLWHLEEPILSSILPTWYLGEAAHRLVKVILIGEGSDEIFAGYRRYWPMADGVRPFVPRAFREWFYLWHFSSLGGSGRDGIFSRSFRRALNGDNPVQSFYGRAARAHGDALNSLLRYEQRYELADFQLLRIDRLTMAHSVEARVPYLDPGLVRFANAMPSRYKLKGNTEKHVLREAMRDILPPEILVRRKQGLGTPLIPWFRSGMYDVARDLLSPANLRARGYFDPQAVERLFRTSRDARLHRDDLGKLFKLVMFEIWHRQFVDGPVRPPVEATAPETGAVFRATVPSPAPVRGAAA